MRRTGDGGRLPAWRAAASWRGAGSWRAAAPWRAVAPWRALAASRQADLAIAAILLLWGLPDVPWWWERPGHAGSAGQIAGALALTVTMSVPFCWRRRFPGAVLLLAGGVLAIRLLLHHDLVSAFAAVLCAAYGLGSYRPPGRRAARWLGWAALAGAVIVVATSHGNRMEGAPLALVGAAFVLGEAASARRSETAAAVEAAHQAERTRIARELHDVVAHQLSAIAVQAGAARLARPAPDPVIGAIERLSREALAELNHLLGALRREPDDDPARPPAPGLADLDRLVSEAGTAGAPVRLAVTGTARPLPPGAELAVYRIVQEALANVARHAPQAPAWVTLAYHGGQLRVTITNPAPPAGRRPAGTAHRPPGGRGVRGMRERAELHGGWLEAGPGGGGGFAVTACLPAAGPPPAPARRDPGAGVREPGAGVREPGAGPRDPGAGVREPGAGPRDPGAGPRDPEVPRERELA
jgi:signal transduction histidine kinase